MKRCLIMKKTLFLLLFLLFISPCTLLANTFSTIELGKLEEGKLKLICGDASINTYKAYNTNYVAVSDLQYLGCQITYSSADKAIIISAPTYGRALPETIQSLANQPFSIYDGHVYLDHFETQSLNCGGRTLIPLAALGYVGTLSIVEDTCSFSVTASLPAAAKQNSVTNLSDQPLTVTVLDLYWKGKAIEQKSTYVLSPSEQLIREATVTDKDAIYIASLIQSIAGDTYSYTNASYLGQLNVGLFNQYTKLTTAPVMVTGYGDPIEANAIAAAEAFVNGKGLSSPTQYLVWTNIDTQRTYIFQGSTNNWKLVKHFICSTGKDSTPTPKGTFSLTRKVPSFGQAKGYCCKYAFGFIGTSYLYHSIIFDKTGTYLLENKGVLGRKASDGCIRFSADNAYWFYTNLVPNTTVYIN